MNQLGVNLMVWRGDVTPELLGHFSLIKGWGYDGWLTVESFGAAIPELAAPACVWRPLAPGPEVLAEESVHFIRDNMSRRRYG
jgi:sugar phosphate isomerase/epimerase